VNRSDIAVGRWWKELLLGWTECSTTEAVIVGLADYWHSATWTRCIERLLLFHGSLSCPAPVNHLPVPGAGHCSARVDGSAELFPEYATAECCAVLIVTIECAPDG